jgi:hypothetical protein
MTLDESTMNLINMDADWADFLQTKVNSFVKWDLVRFFHDNSHAADSAEHIAHITGRDETLITHEINDLVKAGVLVVNEISGVKIYQLTKDEKIRDQIGQFVEACHDRDFRVQAIHHVVQGMQYTDPQSGLTVE